MVRKTEVVEHLLDDVDGSAASESITFAIDGRTYEIDLSKKNAKSFRADLEKWTAHARRPARATRGVRRSTRRRTTSTRTGAATTTDSAAVRAWANESGVPVPSRGRIPRDVLEQYNAAH